MKLFLQVGLTGWQDRSIGNHFLTYASSLAGDIMGTDLESQSDPMIAGLVNRLIDQSKEVFLLVIAGDPNLSMGAAQHVFNSLRQAEQKVFRVILCGEHRSAESMLMGFDTRFYKEANPEKIKELIREFSQ